MSRRDELLELLVDHLEIHGLEDSSVRALAESAGVAHNTLTHHFGTRSELMAAIFQRHAERTAAMPGLAAGAGTYEELLTATWKTLTGKRHQRIWATFYELLGTALREPEQHREFLTHVAEDSTGPLTKELIEAGFAPADAAASATFVVAIVRGLVIDALSGGDPDRIAGAFDLLLGFVRDAAPSDLNPG